MKRIPRRRVGTAGQASKDIDSEIAPIPSEEPKQEVLSWGTDVRQLQNTEGG